MKHIEGTVLPRPDLDLGRPVLATRGSLPWAAEPVSPGVDVVLNAAGVNWHGQFVCANRAGSGTAAGTWPRIRQLSKSSLGTF